MNDTVKQLKALDEEVAKALGQIGADSIASQIKELHQKTLAADFWQDQSTAQSVNRQLSKLTNIRTLGKSKRAVSRMYRTGQLSR
jgi:hypothetical protein